MIGRRGGNKRHFRIRYIKKKKKILVLINNIEKINYLSVIILSVINVHGIINNFSTFF